MCEIFIRIWEDKCRVMSWRFSEINIHILALLISTTSFESYLFKQFVNINLEVLSYLIKESWSLGTQEPDKMPPNPQLHHSNRFHLRIIIPK